MFTLREPRSWPPILLNRVWAMMRIRIAEAMCRMHDRHTVPEVAQVGRGVFSLLQASPAPMRDLAPIGNLWGMEIVGSDALDRETTVGDYMNSCMVIQTRAAGARGEAIRLSAEGRPEALRYYFSTEHVGARTENIALDFSVIETLERNEDPALLDRAFDRMVRLQHDADDLSRDAERYLGVRATPAVAAMLGSLEARQRLLREEARRVMMDYHHAVDPAAVAAPAPSLDVMPQVGAPTGGQVREFLRAAEGVHSAVRERIDGVYARDKVRPVKKDLPDTDLRIAWET